MKLQNADISELQIQYERELAQQINKNLGALNFSLSKLRTPGLLQEIKIRVAQSVLSGSSPRLSDLLEGTVLQQSHRLPDEECVLESEHFSGTAQIYNLNCASSLDLLLVPENSAELKLEQTRSAGPGSTK